MDLNISVQEGVQALSDLFNREITRYPGLDWQFVQGRGRSYARGEAPWVYQNVQEVWKTQEQSRIMCVYNEFALCAVENRVNYVTGEKGFGVEAIPRRKHSGRVASMIDKVNDFIEVFEEANAIDEMISESQMRWDRDGEFFIRLFYGKDGMTRTRFVEPEHVYHNTGDTANPAHSFGIETPEDDVCNPIAYWIAERPWMMPVTTKVDAKYIVHGKLNCTMNQKRGWPTFLSVAPNLLRCEDLLGSMTQIARTRAKIAMVRKLLNVGKDTAEELLERLMKKRVTRPDGSTMNIEQFDPGTILTSNDRTQYEFPDYKFGADDFVEVLQAELRAIASRFKMPEWMFSAVADAKYSNAFVVESTATKEFSKLQRGLQKLWVTNRVGFRRSIYWRAILHAVSMQLLPREVPTALKLICNGPVIVSRNKKEDAEVDTMFYDRGLKDANNIQQANGLNPDDVAKSRAEEFKAGTLQLPLQSMQMVYAWYKDILAGSLPPDAGYSLIGGLVGVPKEVVKEVYPLATATTNLAISNDTTDANTTATLAG